MADVLRAWARIRTAQAMRPRARKRRPASRRLNAVGTLVRPFMVSVRIPLGFKYNERTDRPHGARSSFSAVQTSGVWFPGWISGDWRGLAAGAPDEQPVVDRAIRCIERLAIRRAR